MRQKDIVIGGTYYTYVGESLVQVRVIRETSRESYGRTKNKKTVYEVRRVGEQVSLPKLRTAAALRADNNKFF